MHKVKQGRVIESSGTLYSSWLVKGGISEEDIFEQRYE